MAATGPELVRRDLVLFVDVRIEHTPGTDWSPGPLVLPHTTRSRRQVRSDEASRLEYVPARLRYLLYSNPDGTPIRWFRALDTTSEGEGFQCFAVEILTLHPALQLSTGGEANGIAILHGTIGATSQAAFLRETYKATHGLNLSGAREAIEALLPSTSRIGRGFRQPTCLILVTCAGTLPRPYAAPEYDAWSAADQWIWALTHASDVQPDPAARDDRLRDEIYLSAAIRGAVSHRGVVLVGLRPDEPNDTTFSRYEYYFRTLYTDGVSLAVMQRLALNQMTGRAAELLNGGLSRLSVARLQRAALDFRNGYWAGDFGYRGDIDSMLRGYQRAYGLSDALAQLVGDIDDYSKLLQAAATDMTNGLLGMIALVGFWLTLAITIWAGHPGDWFTLPIAFLGAAALICISLLFPAPKLLLRLLLRSLRDRDVMRDR